MNHKLICVVCGKTFVAHRSDAKSCSKKCRQALSCLRSTGKVRSNIGSQVACAFCGKKFVRRRGNQLYCSNRCCKAADFKRRSDLQKAEANRIREEKLERKRLELERCRETAEVTVEVRGNIVTEWRGPRCIGARAASHLTHN